MDSSPYNLAKRITCSAVLGCVALGWLVFTAKTSAPLSSGIEITASINGCSLGLPPSEPSASASARHVQVLNKDARRPTIFGLTTASLSLVITDLRQYRSFDSIPLCISAARSRPNDRGPPILHS
jgi:hypothetical protein